MDEGAPGLYPNMFPKVFELVSWHARTAAAEQDAPATFFTVTIAGAVLGATDHWCAAERGEEAAMHHLHCLFWIPGCSDPGFARRRRRTTAATCAARAPWR